MLFSNPDLPEDIHMPPQQTAGKTSVLILTADKTEDIEFFYPFYRFIEAGFKVDVATPDGGEFEAKHGLGLKETKKISDVSEASYDLLYIPGGKAPAELKKNNEAIKLVQQFAASGKPIAAICHGPQLLAAADVIRNCRIAAWPEVKDELAKAGASFVNEQTVTSNQFITARWPADLPSHVKQTLHMLATSSSRTVTSRFAA